MGTKNIGLVAEALVKVGDGTGNRGKEVVADLAGEGGLGALDCVLRGAVLDGRGGCEGDVHLGEECGLKVGRVTRRAEGRCYKKRWFLVWMTSGVGGRRARMLSGEKGLVEEELVDRSWWRGAGN